MTLSVKGVWTAEGVPWPAGPRAQGLWKCSGEVRGQGWKARTLDRGQGWKEGTGPLPAQGLSKSEPRGPSKATEGGAWGLVTERRGSHTSVGAVGSHEETGLQSCSHRSRICQRPSDG